MQLVIPIKECLKQVCIVKFSSDHLYNVLHNLLGDSVGKVVIKQQRIESVL